MLRSQSITSAGCAAGGERGDGLEGVVGGVESGVVSGRARAVSLMTTPRRWYSATVWPGAGVGIEGGLVSFAPLAAADGQRAIIVEIPQFTILLLQLVPRVPASIHGNTWYIHGTSDVKRHVVYPA